MKRKLILLAIILTGIIPVNAQDQLMASLSGMVKYVVARDGSGNYLKLQDAIYACPANSATATIIYIKNNDILNLEGWRGASQGSRLVGAADLWLKGNLTSNYFISLSDFNGLPCGDRSWDGGIFYGFGQYGNWWTSRQGNSDNGYNRYISYNQTGIRRSYAYKHNGNSVRCLKD